MDAFASGRLRLTQLCRDFQQADLNEATTRLRYIDTLFTECLNWPIAEQVAEEYYDGEYLDYAFGSPATELIVEAKREGATFSLPAGIAGRQAIMLATAMEDPPTAAAIKQVLNYCQARGVPLAAICNGHQLLAFYASRQDGIPPLKGRAIAFSSLQEMVHNFGTLWNNLSRDGVSERTLQRLLFGANFKSLPPVKLAHTIGNYPGFRARTLRETDLKLLGGLLIQDLESEESTSESFLRECYCSSGALSQYAMVSREILNSRYKATADLTDTVVEPARKKRGVNPTLTADMVTAAMSKRPIIVLGDVGVGKSMFVKHLVRVDAADTLTSSLVLYINFGDEPALETDLESHVYRRVSAQLLNDYGIDLEDADLVRGVYNSEINRFKRGIYGELEHDDPAAYRTQLRVMLAEKLQAQATHLRRTLEHFRATAQRTTVILLDNVDQRPAAFQEQVFLIAQSLASTWPATVFVALRPTTFFESKSKGSLAAYQLRVFTVMPTRVDEVIQRRLKYARRQLDGSVDGLLWPENLSLTRDDLITYLDVLIHAFDSQRGLNELLENISGGNLRLALTYLSAFVGSGFVSMDRILEVATHGGMYEIPMHEFLRAIIFGEYDYFDPQSSEICNIFDCTTDDGREHFLLPLMMAHVQRLGERAGADGFVTSADIFAFAQSCGFSQEQVGPQVARAYSKKLLEAAPGQGAAGPYRITSVGSYMYRAMTKFFVYIDAMIPDTPIADIAVRREITDVRSITERLTRAVIFVDYLDEQWRRLNVEQNSAFDWLAVSEAVRADIVGVRGRLERADRRRAGS